MITKKVMLYGTAIALSGAVMVASGLSARASGQEGYQVWKSAVKQTHQLESATVNGSVKLLDNNRPVLSAAFGAKGSHAAEAASGTLSVEQGGTVQAASFYHQEGQSVLKFDGDDTYYVIDGKEQGGKRGMHHGSDPAMQGHMENLMDAIAGKYKSYLELTEGPDQSKVVTLSLDDDEIPVLLNAAGALLLEKGLSGERGAVHGAEGDATHPFHDKLRIIKPDIGTDVHIEQIEMKTVIGADNYIRQQNLVIAATSKDAQGQEHTWTFETAMGLSGVNQTTADTVSLDGRTVETIEVGPGRH